MRKYCLDLGFAILLFLFSIFALTNIGFLLHLSVNCSYILISFLILEIYIFKSGNFFQKNILLFLIFVLSLVFSMCFIDVSFDGRCYHFTIENLYRLGYNQIITSFIILFLPEAIRMRWRQSEVTFIIFFIIWKAVKLLIFCLRHALFYIAYIF